MIKCILGIRDAGGETMNKSSLLLGGLLAACAAHAQQTGLPASDTLGADDIAGNPTFIGGVANGGGTSHGVW